MSDYREHGTAGSGLIGHSLKLAAAVLVTGLVVMLLVDRRETTAGLSAEPTPKAAASRSAALSELVVKAGPRGHFMVDAEVDGETLHFMIDTGASSIFLTPQDAARLGWTADRLTFSERYETAGGEISAAPVTLRSLRIGQAEFYDLPASVGEQPGTMSLLGMTFLKRFESYRVQGDRLILAW